MRKIIYQGQNLRLGRFGEIKKGDVLFMFEGEWIDIQDDPAFKLHKSSVIEEHDGTNIVPPKKTHEHDLRTIPWNSGRLDRVLTRYARTRLIRIARALIADFGLSAQLNEAHDTIDELADLIHVHILKLGWHKLSREEILTGGDATV